MTRNVLLPVGTDYTPPNKWVTEIHRDWAVRYTWPRFVCGLPREFFAAVRTELAERGVVPSPQTRDMNPIYTGKDVSYIDTKQANRAAENAVLDAERFAVFAAVLTGARYPQAALAKAWVQLAYGAHHDAITGSESDQVYLDLLTGWRDAWELGRTARDNALASISGLVDTPEGSVVVWNPLTHRRTDIVTVRLEAPQVAGVRVRDSEGAEVPAVVEHDGRTVTWLARDVSSLGWRCYRLDAADRPAGWQPASGESIANEHYRLTVDPRAAERWPRWCRTVVSSSPTAGWATSLPSTRNTPRTRRRVRVRGTCCPRGRWSARRNRRRRCGPTGARWASGWWCAAGSARSCVIPKP
ncbi:hypothetical protein NIIDMKKI_63670 [Mycobacterium kansasii]|uniref:Glycoside hydrolase family 38 central domain-containing protein n=1 Tax=Mycobacterium kansasii TaxID=1768 RepID=A0A7G1IJG5_MYCKA|nr:hypothetical protein NIIDMKKI_63670 [Mycobacterium kansasii]